MPKSLQQASKAAVYQSKVQSLDNLGTNLEDVIQNYGMTVIEQKLGEFIERISDNINNAKNLVTTGAINDIEIQTQGNQVNVIANKQLIYQSRGVNGSRVKLYDTPHAYTDKKPPVDVFKQWIKNKQLVLTYNNDKHRMHDERLSTKERTEDRPFKELTEEQLINNAAYAMREKVFQEGFRGHDLYEKEIPKLVEDLQNELADFALQQIFNIVDVKESAKRIIIK